MYIYRYSTDIVICLLALNVFLIFADVVQTKSPGNIYIFNLSDRYTASYKILLTLKYHEYFLYIHKVHYASFSIFILSLRFAQIGRSEIISLVKNVF